MHIASDGGRVCRPLLIVDQKTCRPRMTQAQLVGAWNGWCDIIAEKRARTAAATKVLTRMINSALTAALNTWIEVVVEVRLLRRYHSRQRIYVQRAALRGWVQAITEQKELRENVRKMVNRTEQQAVGVTYRRWISSMYEGREDRAAEREEQVRECALARFVLRKQMAAVADCLRAWDELIASIDKKTCEKLTIQTKMSALPERPHHTHAYGMLVRFNPCPNMI